MSLEQWHKNGWLKRHQPSSVETHELLAVVDRDLRDCQTRGLSEDWRFGIAYNAALQLARIVLHAAGFDTLKGDSHHFRAIDSLQFTIGAESMLIDQFQVFRKKRVAGVYETAGMISDADASGMLRLAQDLLERVMEYLMAEHSDLLR